MALSTSRFKELPESFWEQACAHNPHGLGMMWHAGGTLHHANTVEYSLQTVLEWIGQAPAGCPVAVHLREATRGSRCRSNTHPHVYRGKNHTLALMHNGSLPFLEAHETEGRSDSAVLLHEWLVPRISDAKDSSSLARALAELRTLWPQRNRLIVLDGHGRWDVLGREEGFEIGCTWVSNPRAQAWLSS